MVDFLRGLPFLLRSREKKTDTERETGKETRSDFRVIVVVSSQTVTVPIWLHEYCGFVAAQTAMACDLFNSKKLSHGTKRPRGELAIWEDLLRQCPLPVPPSLHLLLWRLCDGASTASVPTIASTLRPPRLNYRLHLMLRWSPAPTPWRSTHPSHFWF